jgi:hypothetical protein
MVDAVRVTPPDRAGARAGSALARLPRSASRALRGDRGPLHEDLWTLASSIGSRRPLADTTLVAHDLRPFVDEQVFGPDPRLGAFEPFRAWSDREALAYVDDAFVDPKYGWIITRPWHLVHAGLVDIHTARRPSLRAYTKARFGQGSRAALPSMLSLRDRSEQNYGHFVTDLVGGRLRLASECGLDEVPILVSEELERRPFFQDFLRISGIDRERLILQGHQLVRSERVYLCDTSHYSREAIHFVHRILRVPDSDPQARRRLLLARQPHGGGRAFINMADVDRLCRKLGFEIVYTDRMGLEEQMELFSQAAFVVGASGAGLENILFRKNAPMTLLEVFPPGASGVLRPWWFYMASVLGHRYDCLQHGPSPDRVVGKAAYRRDFVLDVDRLEAGMRAGLEATG